MWKQLKWNLWWRKPLHSFYRWYLVKCGGSHHVGEYGEKGRYIVLMTEREYSERRLSLSSLEERILENLPLLKNRVAETLGYKFWKEGTLENHLQLFTKQ